MTAEGAPVSLHSPVQRKSSPSSDLTATSEKHPATFVTTRSPCLDFSFATSPPRPLRRSRGLETTARTKKRNKDRTPLTKLMLELRYARTKCSEFFRCYQEDDVVDRIEMRGRVRDSEADDDLESEEEMVAIVQPELARQLEQAVLDSL